MLHSGTGGEGANGAKGAVCHQRKVWEDVQRRKERKEGKENAQEKTHINTGTVHYTYGPVYTHTTEKARDCVMRPTVPVCHRSGIRARRDNPYFYRPYNKPRTEMLPLLPRYAGATVPYFPRKTADSEYRFGLVPCLLSFYTSYLSIALQSHRT